MTVAHEVGADASSNRRPAGELKAAGVEILVVYPAGAGKAITKPEWDAYLAAGIALALVDEHGNQQMLSGSGFGTQIAQEAIGRARALGLPPTRPLYYVAEDPSKLPWSAWPAVVDRFREICAAHLAAGWVLPGDMTGGSLVGAYGGGPLLEHLYDLGLVGHIPTGTRGNDHDYGWLWAVGTWGACPHACLVQDPNTSKSTLGGAIDWDYLPAGVVDCGQYPAPQGGPEMLDPADPIVVELRERLAVNEATVATILNALAGADATAPDGQKVGMHWAIVDILALVEATKAEVEALRAGPPGSVSSAPSAADVAAEVLTQLRAKPLAPVA